jgi:hypothetical protein
MTTDLEPVDLWGELLRAGEVPPPPDDALDGARAAVRRAVAVELHRARVRRNRRRRLRYGLVAAATVGILAVGAVTVDVGGHRVSGDSAAAAALERAASATLAQHDPVVGPGQYLRVTLVEQSWTVETDDDGILLGRDGQPAATLIRDTRTLWIPADVDEPWVVRSGWRTIRSATSDPRYQGLEIPTTTATRPSWATPGSTSYVRTYDPRWYATLPRDPARLIAVLDAGFTGEGDGLAYRFTEGYSEILRSGLAPAEVRAALFEGLARLPGMEVEGDVETLDGRRGIAIRAKGSRFSMVFDEQTGLYIGEHATDPDFPDVPGLDAERTTWLTSVSTTVVDRAPRAPLDPSRPG